MPKQNIFFILHGKLRSVERLKEKIRVEFSELFEVNFKTTSKQFGAIQPTLDAVNENADIIIIAGGDGSVNEMVNGYFSSSGVNTINFGVLPLGTGNDFVKSLNLNGSLQELKNLITEKSVKAVDIFKMNFIDKSGAKASRFFNNISDIGIGGVVAKNVATNSKILGANFTYLKAIVYSFFKYKKQTISFISNKFNWSGEVLSLCMANGKYFGSGMCVAPEAKLDDQNLQIIIIGDVSLFDYFKNLSKIKNGIKIEHKEVIYSSVKSCKINANRTKCPIDMDGEFIGYAPIEVNLHSAKMNFYYSQP